MKRVLLALCLAVFGSEAWADSCTEEYEFRPLTISLPANFQDLPPRRMDSGMTFVFREKKPGVDTAAVLQITLYGLSEDVSGMQPAMLDEMKLAYLNRFLGGIAQRRESFQKSEPADLKLGNVPFKKVQWTGKAYGTDMAGRMYTAAVKATVVTISAQASAIDADQSLNQLEECLSTLALTGKW